MKPKIFVTRMLPEFCMNFLKQHFELFINSEDRVLEKSEIIANVKDKDALLCLLTDTIDKSVIQAGKQLKVISNYAVGFNNIDVEEATKQKIPVCTTPGVLTEATADLTFALILAITRRIIEADKFTRTGLFTGWAPDLFLGTELTGKTLGIIGMGRIGQAVAKRALGFGMSIVYHSRTDKKLPNFDFLSLEEVLIKSDIISLHMPLTSDTTHLIAAKQFSLMKKTAYLINTTRGSVVNEIDLLQALKTRQIAGAGLDVFEHEPKLTPGLIDLDNIVVLPHIGSATVEARTKMAVMAAENAIAIIQGKKAHFVANPEVF